MPGLAIIVNEKPARDNLSDLRRMVASMQHENFYSSGEYSNETLGVYVGWTCHKGSYSDCMPVVSDDRRRLLFFYGEHHGGSAFNGSHPKTVDATEIMHLVDKHGEAFLEHLNGWFHGVLLDLVGHEVSVFSDRFGMQRLYHYREKEGELFASEAKSLLSVRKKLRALDARGLGELFSCGCVLEGRSLFRGVETVPAGSVVRFRNRRAVDVRTYFRPTQWEAQEPLDIIQFRREMNNVVPKVMRKYFCAPSTLGISLTGGFDTRMIMAYLREAGRSIPCYTFGGLHRECFDVKIARKVAAECDCSHQVISLRSDFFSSFPALAEKTVYLSDGNLGAFNAYELYLNKLAREIGVIRLTGSFGSEVLRGARAFKAVTLNPGLLSAELEMNVRRAVETFAGTNSSHSVSFSVFKHAPWYYGNRLSVEQSQLTVRTPFMDNELVELMYRAPTSLPRQDLSLDLIERGNPRLRQLPTDTGNAPRLQTWWMQALFKADYCYKSGMPQWLERIHSVLGVFQPERFLIGIHRFAHPRAWIRKELASYIREILLDPRTLDRPFFQRKLVEHMVSTHIEGTRNYTDDIGRILSCELTCRLLID